MGRLAGRVLGAVHGNRGRASSARPLPVRPPSGRGGGQAAFTSILRSFSIASAVFGSVTVRMPFS